MDSSVSNSRRKVLRTVEFIKTISPVNIVRNMLYKKKNKLPSYPIPPASLVVSVAGNSRKQWFLECGEQTVHEMMVILRENNICCDDFDAVLDFGCGCGRLLRHLPKHINCDIYGTDYNDRAVKWCQKHLPFASVSKNQLVPPLSYSDNQFDLVYAISVLTHHPEQLQLAWLSELHRVVRRGGYVLLSVRGTAYREKLTISERRSFDCGEYVVQNKNVAGTNLCNSYHPESYLRDIVSGQFTVVSYLYSHEEFKPRPVSVKSHPRHDVVLLKAQ